MQGSNPKTQDSLIMRLGGITHVTLPPISRKLLCKANHKLIAVSLRKHGSRRNLHESGIALHHRGARYIHLTHRVKIRSETIAIHKHMFRTHLKAI